MRRLKVTVRNARFQQWQALLSNRRKRKQAGLLLVQGVRPINQAMQHGWEFREVLVNLDARLSDWATGVLNTTGAEQYALADSLMAELSEKDEAIPELLAVLALPALHLDRLEAGPDFLAVVFDRPGSPGNLGSMIRSADALGADAVVVTGHAVDLFDPKTVRASTGSLFAVPLAQAERPEEVLEWASKQAHGGGVQVVGTDEDGDVRIEQCDFSGSTVLVVGNETAGMSRGWRERLDTVARIPMAGSASSLNAAVAGSIVMWEAAKQRRSV